MKLRKCDALRPKVADEDIIVGSFRKLEVDWNLKKVAVSNKGSSKLMVGWNVLHALNKKFEILVIKFCILCMMKSSH